MGSKDSREVDAVDVRTGLVSGFKADPYSGPEHLYALRATQTDLNAAHRGHEAPEYCPQAGGSRLGNHIS